MVLNDPTALRSFPSMMRAPTVAEFERDLMSPEFHAAMEAKQAKQEQRKKRKLEGMQGQSASLCLVLVGD